MRLTRYSDYALRVLLYVGAHGDRACSIAEIARAYSISQNHLMKIVQELARSGYLATARGRGGGLRLARPPGEIVIGEVVRRTEEDFELVPCGSCVITPACRLRGLLDEALTAFLRVLDGATLADLLTTAPELRLLFALPQPESESLPEPEPAER